MAAMSASQVPYDYRPGPSWVAARQAPSRNPSSSTSPYPMYKHPYAAQAQYEDAYEVDSAPPPDVRVTAPSRAGEERAPDPEFDDERSVYSERMSAPQNFYSSVFQSGMTPSPHISALSTRSDLSRDSWQKGDGARPDSNVDPFSFMKYESPRQQLPKVVVSSPSDASFRPSSRYEEEEEAVIPHPITPPPFQPPPGRVPSAVGARNFSRPNRPPVTAMSYDVSPLQSPSRPPAQLSEEHKREVLERNLNRQRLGQGSPVSQPTSPSSSSRSLHSSPSSPSRSRVQIAYRGEPRNEAIGNEYMAVPTPQSRSSSPSRSSPQGPPLMISQSSSSSSDSSNPSPRTPQGQGLVALPSNPPNMRVSSTESVYSMYSFYQLDNSPATSPTEPKQFDRSKQSENGHDGPGSSSSPDSPKKAKTPASSPHPDDLPTEPETPDDFLALGIAHHEADRLAESAECFEKSATLNGGCAVGMLMWGLSLRHGWGTRKDEARAFKWLKRAAEHAVVDLQEGRSNVGRDAIKKELVLAVYEVGQCFFQGWGVPRDKQMGVSYFQTAAQLGDPDAQQDLAFCLANGKGCKKDRKAAAKWYRAAADQGASTVGLAWIYKPKYAD